MSYPYPAVAAFIATQFVPVRLVLNRTADQPLFREHRVVWTPTLAVLDRRGVNHYQAAGFLPPAALLDLLRIGLARGLMAWSRYDEAAAHLAAAADAGGPLAPEALYWHGAARYLQHRSRAVLMQSWGPLRERYPDSVWAARIPPNQEEEEA
ncbi:MAG TPA: hypothetical protein VFS21_09735 [Roseiflexaceae bacterium]|nr:hypothetical protein [Roseiflexaceae bacterium]